jgi:hypothetical protein
MTGRRGRRPALVAGAVATLAAASVAGSLVTGATAAPTPAKAPASVTATDGATGLTARKRDGRTVAVPMGVSKGLTRGTTAARAVAAPAPAAATAAAAATPKPPAFTALGTTGLVVSATEELVFAPDGSRIAWNYNGRLLSARPDGTGVHTVITAGTPGKLSWSPGGRFISGSKNHPRIFVVSAAHRQVLDTSELPTKRRAVSWTSVGTVVALHGKTMELVPLFGGSVRSYVPSTSGTVVDAVASPDGSRIAAVIQRGAARYELVVVKVDTLTDVATVIPASEELGRPAWSPDSQTVYVPRRVGGATSIVSHAADTAEGEPTVVLADASKTPHVFLRPTGYGAARGTRVTGRDVVDISITRSKAAFFVNQARTCDVIGGATSAVVVAAGSVEATIAAPLAARVCGPVLLTGARSLDKRTAAELKRLLRAGRTVYLVGNTRSLSAAVATGVTKAGFRAVRYGGADVYATAVVVATKGFKDHSLAGIASATQPFAAVAAATTTGGGYAPLLLTKGTTMPKVTAAYIAKYDVGAWAVGSQAVKAAPWAYRYVGADDAGTALKVATVNFYPPYTVGLVGPAEVAVAYAAAADAGMRDYPLLLVAPTALTKGDRAYLNEVSASLNDVLLFGAARRVTSAVLADAVKQAGGRSFP